MSFVAGSAVVCDSVVICTGKQSFFLFYSYGENIVKSRRRLREVNVVTAETVIRLFSAVDNTYRAVGIGKFNDIGRIGVYIVPFNVNLIRVFSAYTFDGNGFYRRIVVYRKTVVCGIGNVNQVVRISVIDRIRGINADNIADELIGNVFPVGLDGSGYAVNGRGDEKTESSFGKRIVKSFVRRGIRIKSFRIGVIITFFVAFDDIPVIAVGRKSVFENGGSDDKRVAFDEFFGRESKHCLIYEVSERVKTFCGERIITRNVNASCEVSVRRISGCDDGCAFGIGDFREFPGVLCDCRGRIARAEVERHGISVSVRSIYGRKIIVGKSKSVKRAVNGYGVAAQGYGSALIRRNVSVDVISNLSCRARDMGILNPVLIFRYAFGIHIPGYVGFGVNVFSENKQSEIYRRIVSYNLIEVRRA